MTRTRLWAGQTHSEAETEAAGRRLGERLESPCVWVLEGDLGSGKSVLARGVLRGLGVTGAVRSPTFTLAIPYEARLDAVHIDLYRLESVAAIRAAGLDEWMDGRQVALIEWGERALPLVTPEALYTRFEHQGGDARQLEFGVLGEAAAPWHHALGEAMAGIDGRGLRN